MEEISLKAQELFAIGNFSITNSLVLALLASLVLIILAIIIRRKITMIPGKIQGAVEMAIDGLLTIMTPVLGTREKAEKYLPLIATIFIFVLTSNWLGLLPGVGSFVSLKEHEPIPLLRSPSADLNFTLALAIVSVMVTNFFGIMILGFSAHIKKFLNFSNPLKFYVGILESLSELSRIISFSFRLFGNIFAGEVLLTVIFFLLPYLVPIPFVMMEIFFGTIQAFIFAMLTLVFLAAHTAVHEEAH